MTLLTTNYCKNPSFEVNVTDDWTAFHGGAGGSMNWDAAQFYVGSHSCRIRAGNNYEFIRDTAGVLVPNNATITASCRVRCSADPTAGNRVWLRVIDTVAGAYLAVVYATAASNGAWEYLSVSYTNTSGGPLAYSLDCINFFADSAADVWFDACQLELAAAATAYTDGSLGGQCAWTGTAHNSTSTRTLATQAAAGAQTNTGAIGPKNITKSFAGAQTNTGNAAKRITLQSLQALSGAISFSGGLVRRAGKALAGAISWIGELFLSGEISEVFVMCADEPPMVRCDPGNLTVQCAIDDPIVRET